jgi:hypothetical protein
VLIPEGFFPTDEDEPLSSPESIDVNDILDYLYGFLEYDKYEKLRRWIDDCKWSLRNKVSIENLAPFVVGLYELHFVEE